MPALTVTGSPTLNGDGSCTVNATSDRIQAPNTGMNCTQGWAAMRTMMLYPSSRTTAPVAGEPCWFTIFIDGSHYIYAAIHFSDLPATGWTMMRSSAGAGDSTFAAESWSVNDKRTVILSWTATTLGLAVNTISSGNFATFANTDLPAIGTGLLDLGSFDTGEQWVQEIFWLAWGSGTLTNTDAANIQAYSDTAPPAIASWAGQPVGLWLGTSFNYSVPFANPVVRNSLPIMSNARI